MQCDVCKIKYPAYMLAPGTVFTDKQIIEFDNVCGICYLAERNKIHGTSETKLAGPISESMRLEAIEWRATHGRSIT